MRFFLLVIVVHAVLACSPALATTLPSWSSSVGLIETYNGQGTMGSIGTGFVVLPGDLVVTNVHVIESAISCVFVCQGHKTPILGVVAHSLNYDLAVLKLASPMPPGLKLATLMPRAGDYIATLGFPSGKPSFQEGVRCPDEPILGPNGAYLVTTPFLAGASGSPVLNQAGEVAGVAAQTARQQNVDYGYVMPASALAVVVARVGALYSYDQLLPDQIKALSSDPEFREAARQFLDGGNNTAKGLFEDLLKTHPDDPLLWVCAAMAAWETGDKVDAARDYRRAVALKLDGGPYWIPVGREAGQDPTLGQMVFCIDVSRAYYNLAALEHNQGGSDRAVLALLQHAVEERPMFAEAWARMGDIYSDSGLYDQAIQMYRNDLKIRPKDALVWSEVGSVYEQLRQKPEALHAYQTALSLQPDLAVAQQGVQRMKD